MILAIDIGNTETVIGLLRDGAVVDHWRISSRTDRTADELGLLLRALLRDAGHDAAAVADAAIGSVVPPLTHLFAEAIVRSLPARPLLVDARTPLPIRLEVDEPLSVGADRIANTLAASHLYRRDTIVVDLGTATTFDCITADGAFVGGVISPGVLSGAESLVRRTARLPRVDLAPPVRVIGTRTETALRSGIFFAAVEAIDGTVRRIRDEWGPADPWVVATGGLAPLLAPHCRSVHHQEPFLTLLGLHLALTHARGHRSA